MTAEWLCPLPHISVRGGGDTESGGPPLCSKAPPGENSGRLPSPCWQGPEPLRPSAHAVKLAPQAPEAPTAPTWFQDSISSVLPPQALCSDLGHSPSSVCNSSHRVLCTPSHTGISGRYLGWPPASFVLSHTEYSLVLPDLGGACGTTTQPGPPLVPPLGV